MMKSLFSGISGLQAHQIAMDVEGHNIANVNTAGFKYSRANFSDMLSQTYKIATSPQGNLGGKNALQVGLGTTISGTTRIFSQGSIQTTDKNTDLAIQGEGFFIVSADGGKSYNYSRNGDFNLDSNGNLVDSNGYQVQGWEKQISAAGDSCEGANDANKVDSTQPIKAIHIEPGLKIPAFRTSVVNLQANLNNGNYVENKNCIYALDSVAGGYDTNGDGVISGVEPVNTEHKDGTVITKDDGTQDIREKANDFGVLFDANGDALKLVENQGVWFSLEDATFIASDTAAVGADAKIDIDLQLNGINLSSTVDGKTLTTPAEVVSYINTYSDETGVTSEIVTMGGNDYIKLLNTNGEKGDSKKNIILTAKTGDESGLLGVVPLPADANTSVLTAHKFTYTATASKTKTSDSDINKIFRTTEDFRVSLQSEARQHVTLGYETELATAGTTHATATQAQKATAISTAYNGGKGTSTAFTSFVQSYESYLTSIAKDDTTATAAEKETFADSIMLKKVKLDIIVDSTGRYEFKNESSVDLNTMITSVQKDPNGNTVQENVLFKGIIESMGGNITSGSSITSQPLNVATHAASIDLYDSLGTKHSLRIEFRKESKDPLTGVTTWTWNATVPKPGELLGGESDPNKNMLIGKKITFNSDGSLKNFDLPSLTFTPNNGAKEKQIVKLNFGDVGKFGGITSFDGQSNTSGISQDGYPGGDLLGVRVDQTGTLIGSFSNGKANALAQVSMAKFTNSSGLSSEGGSLFSQTANSGNPIIGTAGTGGRGSIASSSLEMSNVDLSKALTQLIIIQRGYQANSKTITTSDQLLETLIGIKR